VALRDDDAESDNEDDREARRKEAVLEARERENARGVARSNPTEKQPTGKVVGIIKRNWRP
jgi:exosome complex exonuclease DIS3/RRP44